MPISRRQLMLAAGAVPLLGCGAGRQWRPATLTAEPNALVAMPGGLLIGTAGPGLVGPAGPIPLNATTPYGRQARWASLAVAGGRVLGIGMTHGGAHANARWSIFSGTTAGVTDQDQPFETFHGSDAGKLSAAAFLGEHPLILGSWRSHAAGHDVAVWLPDGVRWRRRGTSGTPLASTQSSLLQATAACGGERLVAVGQAIELSPLHTRAVAWTTTEPDGDWIRIDLPGSATTTSASAVARFADGWLIAGRADDHLVAWRIDTDLNAHALDVPDLAAADVQVAVHDDVALIVAGDGTRTEALVGRSGSWQRSVVPGNAPVAVGWGARPTVITRSPAAPLRMYELS